MVLWPYKGIWGFRWAKIILVQNARLHKNCILVPSGDLSLSLMLSRLSRRTSAKTYRKIAKEMSAPVRWTIGYTVKEDLNFKSYKLRDASCSLKLQRDRRKLKMSALIDNLKHTSSGMQMFFSDKKIFIQDMKPNQQNNRWLSTSPEEVPIVMYSKYPVHIMVLGISLAVMETSWSLSSFLIVYILMPTAMWGFWTSTSNPGWIWWLMEGLMYFNRTLLLPTRPGPPRPGSLPVCLTTGCLTCGLPHCQTVILLTLLYRAFWRVKWTADPTITRRLSRQPSGMPWSIWTGMLLLQFPVLPGQSGGCW